ncbi:gas vesicle protein GvpN [Acidobacteria bacterium AH-259-D05]|nr:gas vesicle protein GvpN [Acidobacteria bacterium AH-259-D05]
MAVATYEEIQPIMLAKEQPNFVRTPEVKDKVQRAALYMEAGYPVHFSGPAGTGKSTLAMYTAAQLGQPVVLIHGEEEFSASDLVGGEFGFRRKKVIDNFIHSVMKTEEDVSARWIDSRLTVACKHGFTLLYDEFTRSRPQANNVLLSVLEEHILDLPSARSTEGYMKVHPNFAAIFTSNPVEYAGAYRAQDALIDRMISIRLAHYDRETEIEITMAKSGVSREEAEKIVDIVRSLRKAKSDHTVPTVRAAIRLGKVVKLSDVRSSAKDADFTRFAVDILDSEITSPGEQKNGEQRTLIENVIKKVC